MAPVGVIEPPSVDCRSAALVKFHAPEIVLGVGSLAEAGFAAARLGARRPFVAQGLPAPPALGHPGSDSPLRAKQRKDRHR